MFSQETFDSAIRAFETAGVPYMVVGSVGVSFYGDMRTTHDMDVLIDPSPDDLARLLTALETDFSVVPEMAWSGYRHHSLFAVTHRTSYEKLDLFFLKPTAFQRTEFDRRRTFAFESMLVQVQSAEDLILSKLDWSRKGESERQFRDAVGVAVMQWANLDFTYMEHWARELELTDHLQRLLKSARACVESKRPEDLE